MVFDSNYRIIFLILFIVGSISGCQTTSTSSPTIAAENVKAQSLRDKAFSDNLNDLSLKSNEKKDVINLIKKYKNGFNRSDKNVIASVISEDFELRYIRLDSETGKMTISAQSRSEYLDRRSLWSTASPRGEKLEVRVLNLWLNKDKTEAVISTRTTYRSKYFYPRYSETMQIKRINNEWRLQKIFIMPLEPKPNEVKVSLISSANKKSIESSDLYQSTIDTNGPDAIFEKYIKLVCCIQDIRQPLVVVFAEPPAHGAIIIVRENEVLYGGVYTTRTRFVRTSPYTIFVGSGWYGAHLIVDIEVLVDGILVGTGSL